MSFKKELTFFDVTSIVVGSIVGADIYIAASITAGLLGPSAILVWIVAGLCATIIALVFAYCSYYVPRVGGPFAFVSEAFDDFYGFLTGWSIWIAEILSLPVFAIAFVQYLQYFIVLDAYQQILIKGVFLFSLTYVNIRGVKAAGRLNDILTMVKLAPLLVLIVVGVVYFLLHPHVLSQNYLPFAPLGFKNFGAALVLIFWAYIGFEMGTLPASEVKNPRENIPRAIITGMIIVTIFYLLTNFIVYGTIHWTELAATRIPLVVTGSILFGTAGAVLMGVGRSSRSLVRTSPESLEPRDSPMQCPSTVSSRNYFHGYIHGTKHLTWPSLYRESSPLCSLSFQGLRNSSRSLC